MMAGIARTALGPGYHVVGHTAANGPSVILDPAQLRFAADEVVGIAMGWARQWTRDETTRPDAVIVAAFGDPAVDTLRRMLNVPTFGIAASAIREAARNNRRFGIVTTTPRLAAAIDARVEELGFARCYTGIRLTDGMPEALMTKPDLLRRKLADAVSACARLDGANAVIIGGGPLAAAADSLSAIVNVPIIAPLRAACRAVAQAASS
jgi:Asp/Glu/hydantoin racemase